MEIEYLLISPSDSFEVSELHDLCSYFFSCRLFFYCGFDEDTESSGRIFPEVI